MARKKSIYDLPYQQVLNMPASDVLTRLSSAESSSYSTLPTGVSLSLAQNMRIQDRELRKAARLLAHQVDIPPAWLFQPNRSTPYNDYKIDGQTIRAGEARRLIKPYDRYIIASLLEPYLEKVPDQLTTEVAPPGKGASKPGIIIPGHGRIDPGRVAEVVKAFGPVRDPSWGLNEMLAAAIGVAAKRRINIPEFASNLSMVMQAPGLINAGGRPSRAGQIPQTQQVKTLRIIAIAQAASERGVKFNSPTEVLTFVTPQVAGDVQAVQEAQARQRTDPVLGPLLDKGDPASPNYDPNSEDAKIFHDITGGTYHTTTAGLLGTEALVTEGILQAITDAEGNYVKTAHEIANNIRLNQEAFTNSALGKALGTAFHYFDRTFDVVFGIPERILFDKENFLAPFESAGDESGRTAIGDTLHDVKDIFFGRQDPYEALAEEGVPTWLSAIGDAVVGFYFGPDVLLLKAISKYKAGRLITSGERALTHFTDFADKAAPDIIRVIRDSETPELAFLRLNANWAKTYGSNGLHPLTQSRLFQIVKDELRLGRSEDELVADIKAVLALPFGYVPASGSVADRIVKFQEFVARESRTGLPNLAKNLQDPRIYGDTAERFAGREADRVGGLLSDWEYYFEHINGPIEFEVPHRANILARGFRHEAALFADTGVGRALGAARAVVPAVEGSRLTLNLEDGARMVEDFGAWLKRSRVFAPEDAAKLLLEAGRYIDPLVTVREAKFSEFVRKVEDDMVRTVAKQYGATDEKQIQYFLDALDKDVRPALQRRSFGEITTPGVLPPGITAPSTTVRNPIGVSQLENAFTVIDPVALRKGIAETIGTYRQMRSTMLRTLRATLPEAKFATAIKGVTFRKALNTAWEIATRDLFLSWWKPLAVIRPAYVMRVVATEEQGRFLATAGLTNRLKSGKQTSRLFDASGNELRYALTDAPEGAATELVVPGLPALYDDVDEFSNTVNKFGLPQETGPIGKALAKRGKNIGAIGREQGDAFYAAWMHDLTKQGAEDPILRMFLEDIRDEVSEQDSADRVFKLLSGKDPEYRQLGQRLMQGSAITSSSRGVVYSNEALRQQVDMGAAVMRSYAANPDIARYALNGQLYGEDGINILKSIPEEFLPHYVHGPELEMVSTRYGPLKHARDTIADAILRTPTNRLSRQPYGNFWKDQMYRALLDAHGGPLPEAELLPRRVSFSEADFSPLDDVPVDAGYVYHVTGNDRLDAIAVNGLRPSGPLSADSDLVGKGATAWEDGGVDPRVYFATDPKSGYGLTKSIEDGAVLRVRDEALSLSDGAFPGERFTTSAVPPRDVEYLAADGKWYPLAADGAISYEKAGLLEKAATRFGAEQVNRIMFDFTRQNRLGEAMSTVFPFFQPFAEQFTVWGRILAQKPQLVAYVAHLARVGEQSGFLKENERGELEVPLSMWAGAAPLLSVLYGVGGWGLSAPLTSFNVFLQSAIPIPVPGAGELPVPLPGLNPLVNLTMQKFLESSAGEKINPAVRARLASYLYQYGPVTGPSLLPSYLRNFMMGVAPGWFEDEMNRTAASFENLQAYMGLEVDPDKARFQAREMAFFKAFTSFIFPTPPQYRFPQAEWEQEWRDLNKPVSEGGLPYTEAVDEFIRRHGEGARIFTVGKTALDPDSPFPVTLPPVEGVQRLLMGKGARGFIQDHPRWAWAIIPKELSDGKFDPSAYFAFLAQGWTQTLSPEERADKADVQAGWDAYFAHKESWLAWQEAHPDIGINNVSYDKAKFETLDKYVDQLKLTNPAWADAFGRFENSEFTPTEEAEARALAKDKLFKQTEVGHALGEWLVLYDDVREKMRGANVSNLFASDGEPTAGAKYLGLDKEYTDGVAKIVAEHPDFQLALDVMLSGALKNVSSAYDDKLQGISDDNFKRIVEWETHWEKLKDIPSATSDPFEQYDSYQERRGWVTRAYQDFDAATNPVLLWWDKLGEHSLEQRNYRANLAALPYPWLTQFDRTVVLGDKTNPKTEALWAEYNQRRSEISKREAFDRSGQFSSGEAFDKLNRWVQAAAKRNKVFATQVEHANEWGYGFKVQEDQLTSPQTREYWDRVLDAARTIQGIADKHGLTGSKDFNPQNKAYFNDLKTKLVGYIDLMKNDSAAFAREWDDYEKENGTNRLIDAFVPESYFPIGVIR